MVFQIHRCNWWSQELIFKIQRLKKKNYKGGSFDNFSCLNENKKGKKKGKLIWLIVWMSHEVEKINQKKNKKNKDLTFQKKNGH